MRWRLLQKVVYWAPVAADTFGRPSVASPVQLAARWEDRVAETIDGTGNTVLSSATVFLATVVKTGGVLMLGGLAELGSGFPANPKADHRCHEIISVGTVPSLKNIQSLVTAMLK